jgi:beta-lactamase regulating signal transducer with metallopeptidase domain
LAALLQIGLVNAIVATLLAIAVALIARHVRRPALVHALWIVVLVKLVTPPLFRVPVEVPFPVPSLTATPAVGTAIRRGAPRPLSAQLAQRQARKVRGSAGSQSVNEASTSGLSASVRERASVSVANAVSSLWTWITIHKVGVIGWIWLGGSLTWFLVQGFTAVKFSRRLALATPATATLQHQADELARAMGLACRPPVMIVRDVISPMLWGIGKNTRLLFPVELLSRLDTGARSTLIAHELAHFHRGDHWVRAFELVVTGLFWWHPVVWWARREIEITEEECCDGWVIEQFPAAQRSYAEALLETLDFISDRALVLPPAAAGAGHVPFLRRRITAIMRGVAPKKMSAQAWLAVSCLAFSSLPWHPRLIEAQPRTALTANQRRPAISKPPAPALRPADSAGETTDLAGFSELLAAQIARITSLQQAAAGESETWATARSHDNRFSVTRRGKEGVSLHDSLTGQSIGLSEHSILTVAFAPDGYTFATGGADKAVRLWDSITGELKGTFRGHPGSVQAVVFVNDGKELITASRDGSLKRWSVELLDELPTLKSRAVSVNCLAVSSDGRSLAIGSGSWMSLEGGRVFIWDLVTETEQVVLETALPVAAVAFRSENRELLAGDYQGHVTFWDLTRKQVLGRTLPRFKDAVAAARFSLQTEALGGIGHGDIAGEPEPEIPSPPVPMRLYFDPSARLGASSESVAVVADESTADTTPQFSNDSAGLRSLELRIGALERELGARDSGTTRGSPVPQAGTGPSNRVRINSPTAPPAASR